MAVFFSESGLETSRDRCLSSFSYLACTPAVRTTLNNKLDLQKYVVENCRKPLRRRLSRFAITYFLIYNIISQDKINSLTYCFTKV